MRNVFELLSVLRSFFNGFDEMHWAEPSGLNGPSAPHQSQLKPICDGLLIQKHHQFELCCFVQMVQLYPRN